MKNPFAKKPATTAPLALPPAPVTIPPVRLNVDTDAWVTNMPRVAGVERTIIANREWLDCSFEVKPATEPTRGHQRGFAWTAEFKVKDSGTEHETFKGTADSRKLAYNAAVDALTKKIRAVADERKRYLARTNVALKSSAEAGIATSDGFMHR